MGFSIRSKQHDTFTDFRLIVAFWSPNLTNSTDQHLYQGRAGGLASLLTRRQMEKELSTFLHLFKRILQ